MYAPEGEERAGHQGLHGPQRDEEAGVEHRGAKALVEGELEEDGRELELGEAVVLEVLGVTWGWFRR